MFVLVTFDVLVSRDDLGRSNRADDAFHDIPIRLENGAGDGILESRLCVDPVD
jgi:hypothetical protein